MSMATWGHFKRLIILWVRIQWRSRNKNGWKERGDTNSIHTFVQICLNNAVLFYALGYENGGMC